jgi:hypothetical protein
MKIQFMKRADGSAVFKCVRPDGSVSWQKQEGKHAMFFPLHDLTHYAVETELGFRRGFFGLIAEGWDIAETTGKNPGRPLPEEAIEVEYLVSAFSAERAGGGVSSAAEFNELAATFARSKGMAAPRQLSGEELARVRAQFAELATRWRALPAGETLGLAY